MLIFEKHLAARSLCLRTLCSRNSLNFSMPVRKHQVYFSSVSSTSVCIQILWTAMLFYNRRSGISSCCVFWSRDCVSTFHKQTWLIFENLPDTQRGQEFDRLHWAPKFRNSPPLLAILSQINPVYALPHTFHFKITKITKLEQIWETATFVYVPCFLYIVFISNNDAQYTGCFTTLGHNCRRWFPRSLWWKKII